MSNKYYNIIASDYMANADGSPKPQRFEHEHLTDGYYMVNLKERIIIVFYRDTRKSTAGTEEDCHRLSDLYAKTEVNDQPQQLEVLEVIRFQDQIPETMTSWKRLWAFCTATE